MNLRVAAWPSHFAETATARDIAERGGLLATGPHHRGGAAVVLATLGVVYGDIGTSPLYALRECFYGSHSVTPTHDNVLGVLSLIIYSLVLVISGMPGMIRKFVALPAMRKRPYRMLLDREGNATADIPVEKGKVTVLRLDMLKIEAIEYADSAAKLRADLEAARRPTS